jgi:hypothetical protein
MQFNKSMSLVENLYNIIGISASRFNPEQLDFLLVQINKVKFSFFFHSLTYLREASF